MKTKYQPNKWYKVIFKDKLYDGTPCENFVYMMNTDTWNGIKAVEDEFRKAGTYLRTELWTI